ncbi:MAG: SusC/RagA family TonB-linked outer membrane protein [Cytophagales bacterium]|nr:SusC/RagA family TonB-linked outer membrane protein [Cytophagales bacterium]
MKKIVRCITLVMTVNFFAAACIPCLCAGLLIVNEAYAQSVNEVLISIDVQQVSIEKALETIEGKTRLNFVYAGKALAFARSHTTTLEADNMSVANVLKNIARQTGASFRQVDNNIVVKAAPVPATKKEPEKVLPKDKWIEGKVTDENGEPLAGANVMVKNTSIGTVTDVGGNYRLRVPDKTTVLVVSYIGYGTREIEIAGKSVIDAVLQEDVTSLAGVTVSTGYWQTDEKAYTGNIAKVGAQEIGQQSVTNPLQALQGRMAGVNIQQLTGIPGGGFQVQIRGLNSVRTRFTSENPGNSPLYIVDGIPFPSSPLGSLSGFLTGFGNPLNSLNPNNIESIEILKDADATAIYGSRGANGVVLITTKKGTSGKTSVDVNVNSGVGKITGKMDLLTTAQYLEMRNEAFENDGATPGASDYDLAFGSDRNTDWQEELIGGTARFTDAQVLVSGGDLYTTYLFGVGYQRQTTVLPGDFVYRKGSGNFSLNHTAKNQRFSLNLSTNYTADQNDLPKLDPTFVALTKAPNAPPLLDENGNFTWDDPNKGDNTLAQLARKYRITTGNFTSNLGLEYNLLPTLQLKGSFGYSDFRFDELKTSPASTYDPVYGVTGGNSDFIDGNVNTWIIEPQLEYTRQIAGGYLTTLVGSTFQQTTTKRELLLARGFQDENSLENPAAASEVILNNFRNDPYRYSAVFARINYNWQDKYILNLTGRRDGSSRFGPYRRFGNFGAIGAAWVFSNEPFIKSRLPFLSFGKLRGSFGITGNDNTSDFEYLDSYSYSSSGNYLGVKGLVPTRIGNPVFSWETIEKIEGAIELGILEDRVLLEISYFRHRTSDQLVGFPVSDVTGFSSLQDNFPAIVGNTGWELELNTTHVKSRNFEWSTGFNVTFLDNELREFPGIENTPFDWHFEVDKSLFILKGLEFTGVDPQTGVFTYVDASEDGTLLDFPNDNVARKEIGTEYFGGLSNSLSYRGFQLDFLLHFVKQNGLNYIDAFSTPGTYGNQPTIVMNRWQQPGDLTEVPRFTQAFEEAGLNYAIGRAFGDNRITDASFIRLQNLSLSWHFPDSWRNKLKLRQGRIYLQGQNLLTFTNYLGLDPESRSFSRVPPLRIFTAGIHATL